jgi:hypothetical protein
MSDEIAEITGGNGSLNVNGQRSYVRRFRLVFDNPVYDANAVIRNTLLPAAYSLYPGDPYAVLVSSSAQQDGDPGRGNLWIVTCNYADARTVGDALEQSSQSGNQFDQQDPEVPILISWSSREQQVFREVDLDGKLKCNSAGEPMQNVAPDIETFRVATIKYFTRQKPDNFAKYVNYINSEEFTVDGETAEAECARIVSVTVGDYVFKRGVLGRDITVVIEIGDPTENTVRQQGVDKVNPNAGAFVTAVLPAFRGNFLDQGYSEISPTTGKLTRIQLQDGSLAAQPFALASGFKLATPVDPQFFVYRTYRRFKQVDFNTIFRLPQ